MAHILQPIRSMLSRNPGWSVTTSKRMRWRRLAAPPPFKLQSSVTTSRRMRWRRLAAPPLFETQRANPETAFELTTMFAEGVC